MVEADHFDINTHLLWNPIILTAIKTQTRENITFSLIASEYQKLTGYSEFSIFRKTMHTAVSSTKFSMTRHTGWSGDLVSNFVKPVWITALYVREKKKKSFPIQNSKILDPDLYNRSYRGIVPPGFLDNYA
jgi:hypothetical protein